MSRNPRPLFGCLWIMAASLIGFFAPLYALLFMSAVRNHLSLWYLLFG